jgi:hypothetical protein
MFPIQATPSKAIFFADVGTNLEEGPTVQGLALSACKATFARASNTIQGSEDNDQLHLQAIAKEIQQSLMKVSMHFLCAAITCFSFIQKASYNPCDGRGCRAQWLAWQCISGLRRQRSFLAALGMHVRNVLAPHV